MTEAIAYRRKIVDGDQALIRRMRQGNEEAFNIFVRRYYGDILKYCSYRCSGIADAQDLTQETFVRFFTHLSAYRHLGKVRNYLYTIAGNLCRDYGRQHRNLPVPTWQEALEAACYEETEDSRENAGYSEATADIHRQTTEDVAVNRVMTERALERLPDELREAVILYYFQELKIREIADILQIGQPLVKYRLRKAKEKLREIWEEGS